MTESQWKEEVRRTREQIQRTLALTAGRRPRLERAARRSERVVERALRELRGES